MIKRAVNKFESIGEKIFDKFGEKKFLKIYLAFFLIIALIPIFIPGIFAGHDIHFHLSRINGIVEGLKAGTFPVLIYPGYFSGYGYANGVFYPDLFLYIPAILNLLGLSTILSYKILLILITIGILASMYFCVKKITNSSYIATIISVLYLMSSYRMTDMWIRAALGETITFVFFPLVILGLYEIIYGNEKNWRYFTIGLLGIVFSHIISSVFCLLITIVFCLLNIKKLFKEKNRLKSLLIGGCLAIGISAFFTFPLMEAMLSDTFNYVTYQLKDPIYNRSVNLLLTFLDIPTGKYPWVPQGIGVVFIYLLFKSFKKSDTKDNSFKKISFILGLILLFMTTSLFPWKTLGKYFSVIQFPWRLYILVILLWLFFSAISMPKFIKTTKDKIHTMLVLSIFICISFSISFVYLVRYGSINDYFHYSIISAEYVPVDVDYKLFEERGNVITSNNEVDVTFVKNGSNIEINYENNNDNDTYLELPLLYYKGYVAKENSNNLLVEKGTNGVVRLYLNNNSGNIHVYYGITKIRKIGIILSIISSLIFVILCMKSKKE